MIKAVKKGNGVEVTIGDPDGSVNGAVLAKEFVSIYASLNKNCPEVLDIALEVIEKAEKEGLFTDDMVTESED